MTSHHTRSHLTTTRSVCCLAHVEVLARSACCCALDAYICLAFVSCVFTLIPVWFYIKCAHIWRNHECRHHPGSVKLFLWQRHCIAWQWRHLCNNSDASTGAVAAV
jgi:hypothetical protein